MSGAQNKKPVKTLFVTHGAEFGGAELSLFELLSDMDRELVAPELACLARGSLPDAVSALGIPTHIIPAPADVLGAKRSEFRLTPASVVQAGTRFAATRPVVRDLQHLIRERAPQVVYTNSTKAHILGGEAARRCGKPVIWHLRDYPAQKTVRLFFSAMANFLAHTVICNSRFTAGPFQGHRRCRVVLNGLPWDRVKPERDVQEVLRELGVPPDAPVVGTVGRLVPLKGLHLFITAASQVAEKHPGARFLIVGAPLYGDHSYARELELLARNLGMQDHIIFTGFREDIYDVINAFDVSVHASQEPESFGRSIVEAMYLRKPVVVSGLGAFCEIVEHEATGLIFAPGDVQALADAICALLDDSGRSADLGGRAHEHVASNFNIRRCLDEVTEIILECAHA